MLKNVDETAVLVGQLNDLLAREHACAIRYATHAAVLTGPSGEAVASRLNEIAADEIEHARRLRRRIVALGGQPTMEVRLEELKHALTLAEILEVDIREERQAIERYASLLKSIPQVNAILYDVIEKILRDEQEHLEELRTLRPVRT